MSKTISDQLHAYRSRGFSSVWNDALYALWRVNVPNNHNNYVAGPRMWHYDLRQRYNLHPVIVKLVNECSVRPLDWHLLMLEWPHVSEEDDSMLAYTRNEGYGLANRQVRTTLGKYLARHYAHLPAHTLRDLAGLHAEAKYDIWRTPEGIIAGIELGAQSCMKSSYGSIPFREADSERLTAWFSGQLDVDVPWHKHPYSVYDPALGWGMAVRLDKGKPDVVVGRALVYADPDKPEQKCFVRSYMRPSSDGSYSESDARLEAWLREQGYKSERSWPTGAQMRAVRHPGDRSEFMLPYIDGGRQKVSQVSETLFEIDPNGTHTCTNTDGTADTEEPVCHCDDCGAAIYEDDAYYNVGINENRTVCSSCGDYYTRVEGTDRWSSNYYVPDHNAVEVRGRMYDTENLPDCIVWSEYADTHLHIDNAVFCITDDEYYPEDDTDALAYVEGEGYYRKDDDTVVECYDGNYRLRDDCWESGTGNWYSDDVAGADVSEGKYTAEELQELIDNI